MTPAALSAAAREAEIERIFWATATGIVGEHADMIEAAYRATIDPHPVCGAMAMACEMRRRKKTR